MKELSFEQMEEVTGGGFINGACAVIGFGGSRTCRQTAIGMAINPVAGTIIGLAGVACFAYSLW